MYTWWVLEVHTDFGVNMDQQHFQNLWCACKYFPFSLLHSLVVILGKPFPANEMQWLGRPYPTKLNINLVHIRYEPKLNVCDVFIFNYHPEYLSTNLAPHTWSNCMGIPCAVDEILQPSICPLLESSCSLTIKFSKCNVHPKSGRKNKQSKIWLAKVRIILHVINSTHIFSLRHTWLLAAS